MVSVVVFLFLLYFLLVMVLIAGWHKAIAQSTPKKTFQQGISVVVSVRNEEDNIGLLLRDLRQQVHTDFEVIVVDDHSEDHTRTLVQEISDTDNRFRLIRNPGEGKKQALTAGIRLATNGIIVTTDADCRLESRWLSIIDQYFQEDRVKMLIGGVRIQQTDTFFTNLQALEFSTLIGTAGATLALGFPTMCNGANLAFRTAVFEEVSGYEGNLHVPSGDDEFLLHKISQKYSDGVLFCNRTEAIVETRAARDLRQFVHQRIRWAGKWRFNSSFYSKVLALFILLLQLSSIFVLLQVITGPNLLWGMIMLLKILVEGIFIFVVCRFLKVRWSSPAFLVWQFIYPYYVVSIGLLSTLLPYTWKGRKIQPVIVSDKL